MSRYELHQGDSRDVLELMPSNSVDSVVTDPPYALVSIVKRFGKEGAAPAKDDVYARAAAGFMGKAWDTGEVAHDASFWFEVLRVLKPGGHLLAFGGTRTYHRLAVAVEDAGFEIRDQIGWAYGSGFPKSHNQGDGWGTALKPAWEPIVMARKPLDGTVAANIAAWGTGAINIEGCRVAAEGPRPLVQSDRRLANNTYSPGLGGSKAVGTTDIGRWPANIIHDGSDEVLAAFPQAPGQLAKAAEGGDRRKDQNVYGAMTRGPNGAEPRDNGGSAARFFYCAKASKEDRNEGCEGLPQKPSGMVSNNSGQHITRRDGGAPGPAANHHPTVKPTKLMRYLCRLVTPPGGVVLDPFMGSGSTGKAALLEGFRFIGIEREAEYLAIAKARVLAADAADKPNKEGGVIDMAKKGKGGRKC